MNNCVVSVRINNFDCRYVELVLKVASYQRVRYAQKLIDYLCGRFKIDTAKVNVSNIDGISCYSDNNIYIYNNFDIGSFEFFDILIKYFVKHYDRKFLKLNYNTFDNYFYKRVENLKTKLLK